MNARPSHRRSMLAASLVVALATASAWAADPGTEATGGKLSRGDRGFVEKAAIGGMVEVEMGKLAQQKATDAQVKSFGAKMVTDHTKAGDELKRVASAKGVTPPSAIDKSHRDDIADLAKKSGADFDKAYVKAMVSDHKDDISLFEKTAKDGEDADLKSYASKTLPTLQEHRQMIQGISDRMK